MHACIFKNFEEHFEFLYDNEVKLLFENWTVHTSYGNEIINIESMNTFINEILSSAEIHSLKSQPENSDEPSPNHPIDLNKTYQPENKNFALYRMKTQKANKKNIDHRRFERLSSLVIPKDSVQRQIWQSALDVLSQSIRVDSNYDISSESDNHDDDNE